MADKLVKQIMRKRSLTRRSVFAIALVATVSLSCSQRINLLQSRTVPVRVSRAC